MPLFCWTQRKIFWRMWKQSSSGAPLTSIVFMTSSMSSQWCINTAWLQTFFRISSFVFSRTKTFIQVWNYLRVSKWYNFYFWVNYPFNSLFKIIQNTYTEDHSPSDPWLTTQSKFSAHVLSSAVDSCNVLRIGVAKITICHWSVS